MVSAYTALFGGFLLLGGRCGDLLGKRVVFIAGVSGFTAASLVCGVAPSDTVLIAGRAAQGLAAAFVAPATLALITTIFPQGAPRDRAMGIWGAVTGVSASLGVICGGVLADGPGWRWIFFINIPIGIALLVAAPRYLPNDARAAVRPRLDFAAAATATVGTLALVFAAAESAIHEVAGPRVLLPFAVAVVCFAAFIVQERRGGPAALVPLKLLRNRGVAAANVVAALVGSAMLAMFFFLSLYQQQVLHLSALETGLNYLPLTGLLMGASFVAAVLTGKFGVRVVLTAGCTAAAAGMVLLSGADADSSVFAAVIGPSLLLGPGLAFAFIGMTMAAVTGVPPDVAGLASGLANATRTAGGALGLAVISAVVTSQGHSVAGGITRAAAASDAISVGFVASAALMAVAGVAALVAFAPRAQQ